jgi:2-C-methyl-D-erythritol 2,4-cyclodiphosphate synthase
MFKVGLGYDLHRLAPGRALFLGGIEVPAPAGLVGHSDGDALIHALIDALLGAMGEGDIGQLFPDRDPRFKDIRSTILLRDVCGRLKKKRLAILHADAVVVAEAPKLGPHFPAMKDALCPILGILRNDLGLKAKTNEGLGLIGRGKAVACWAVVILGSRSSNLGKKA